MIPLLAVCLSTRQPHYVWTEGWTATPYAPLQLAQIVDSRLHQLRETELSYNFDVRTALGHGDLGSLHPCLIAGPTQFRLEYDHIGDKDTKTIQHVILVGNGRRFAVKRENEPLKIGPMPTTRPLPKDLLKDWFKGDVGDLFAAVGSQTDPVTDLVRAAQHPGSGYVVKAAHRQVDFQGHKVRDEHITIERGPALEKKEGKLLYEITIDDHWRLPVAMTNSIDVGLMRYGTRFSANWHFLNPKKGEKINLKDLAISRLK